MKLPNPKNIKMKELQIVAVVSVVNVANAKRCGKSLKAEYSTVVVHFNLEYISFRFSYFV